MKRTLSLIGMIFLLSMVYFNLDATTSQRIFSYLTHQKNEEPVFFVESQEAQTEPQTQTQSQSQTQTQTQTEQTQTLYIGFPAELSWKYKTPAPVIAQPQTDATHVYVASRNGSIHRVVQETGKAAWRTSVGDSVEESFLLDAGVLYVATLRGILTALNAADGKPIWKQTLEGEEFTTQPAVDESSVFFVSRSGIILSVSKKDGTIQWKFKAQDACTTTPYYYDGKVYVGCNDRNLYALDSKAGFVKWKFVAGSEIMGSPVANAEGVCFGSEDGIFYWLDSSTGREQWKYQSGGAIRGVPMIYYNERLQRNSEILFASFDNFLYSLRIKDGGRKWLTGTVARVFSRMHLDRALIFMAPFGPNVYGFDPHTGKRVGEFDATARIRSAPITANDRLFLGMNDGRLVGLKRQPPPPPESEESVAQTQSQTQTQTETQTQTQTQTEAQTQTQTQTDATEEEETEDENGDEAV